MTPDMHEVEPRVFLVLQESVVYEARVDGETVTIGGVKYVIANLDPRKWNPAAAGAQAHGRVTLKAPMPGKVVRVLVAVGEEVVVGQGLVVIEAMKMQNELKTTRAGRVVTIGAKENETVEAGTVLVVVE